MFALALFGLFVSGYLAFAYFKVMDLACTDTGCDTIRGWHDQRLPRATLPLVGILYFLALTGLAYLSGVSNEKNRGKFVNLAMGLGAVGTLVVAGLTSVEASLNAYCFWCLLVAGTTLLYFVLSVLEWSASKKGQTRYETDFEPFLKWGLVPVIIGILMVSTLEKSESVANPTPAPGENAPSVNAPLGNTAGGNEVSANAPPVSPTMGGGEATPSILSIFNTTNPTRKPDDAQIALRLKSVKLVPAHAHIKGAKKAKVTLVEFADPGCSHCADQAPILDQLVKKYPKDLRLVYRHFPLRSHVQSRLAAEAMEAAGAQGKFFEMRDILFRNLGRQSEPEMIEYAKQIGLNVNRFTQDLQSHKYAANVQQDRVDADAIGITRTPTLILNDYVFSGPLDLNTLDQVMKALLAKTRPAPAASKSS